MSLDPGAAAGNDTGQDDYSVVRVRDKLGYTLRAYIEAISHQKCGINPRADPTS